MSKTVALPWYHRTDWPALHAAFTDREVIPDCYDSWKTSALSREAKWREDGYNVERIELRPDAFRDWCARQKRQGDYASRRAYVEEVLSQRRVTREIQLKASAPAASAAE